MSGLVNGETAAVLTGLSASGASGTNAGSYTNTVTGTGSSNYNLTLVDGSLEIEKVNATVTGNSASVTYNGAVHSVAGFTASGLVNHQTVAVLTGVNASGATAINAGTYINALTGTDTNYNLTLVDGSLVIGKANATVTGNSASVTYTGAAQSVAGFTATGLVNNQTIAVLTGVNAAGVTRTNAGTFINKVTGSDNNYNLTLVDGTLLIGKAALLVTADNQTRLYGNANPTLTYTVTGYLGVDSGAVLSGIPTLTTAANLTSHVGTVPILAAANTLTASNYNITYANGVMNITARPITVKADADQFKTVGSADPILTYSLEANGTSRGLVGGDIFSGKLSRAAGELIGNDYAIDQGSVSNRNYIINYIPSKFSIKPQAVTTSAVGTLMSSIVSDNNFQTSPAVMTPAEAPTLSQVNVTQTNASSTQALTVITAQVPVTQLNDFSFKVPDQIAQAITSSGSVVIVQLADGRELPSWLKFDRKTMEFKAQANVNAPELSDVIRVSIKFGDETVVVEIKAVDTFNKP
ncbi:MAG: hypothetical protein RL462_2 [Pseudomonadota bacterium]